MNIIEELLSNRILVCGCVAWLCAQVLKTAIYSLVNHRLDLTRLYGDGGMPSGHSATVAAMATMSAVLYGLGSFEFAVTLLLAIIVMGDCACSVMNTTSGIQRSVKFTLPKVLTTPS